MLLSTLVWENGGLAGAHSIANVLADAGFAERALHGELVAFGLLVLLWLQGLSADRDRLEVFYSDMGLPRSVSALGIPWPEGASVAGIASAVHARWKKHGLRFSADDILKAIEALERGAGP